jgi:thiol-disulfide isomerase/thioredoxin
LSRADFCVTVTGKMSQEPDNSIVKPSSQKLRLATSLLVVALALLAFEALHYLSAPPLDAEQKTLLAWVGAPAPDFTVTNLDGQVIRLSDLKGKRVILNFWATWCGPCRVELPDLIKLRAETSPTNIFILGLSTEDAATQKSFAQRNGINFPLAILQHVPSPYQDIDKIPETLVIDRNGVVQEAVLGPQELRTLERFAAEPDYAGPVKSAPVESGK